VGASVTGEIHSFEFQKNGIAGGDGFFLRQHRSQEIMHALIAKNWLLIIHDGHVLSLVSLCIFRILYLEMMQHTLDIHALLSNS
jgi:hypothetical protein